MILSGKSASGHLAVMAGVCTKLDAVKRTGEHLEQPETPAAIVDWYGPADLTAMSELALGTDTEESGGTADNPAAILQQHGDWTYAELSTTTYVRSGVPPMFVAHGANKDVRPQKPGPGRSAPHDGSDRRVSRSALRRPRLAWCSLVPISSPSR